MGVYCLVFSIFDNESIKADKMISNVYCIKEVYLKQTKTLFSYLNIILVNSNDVSVSIDVLDVDGDIEHNMCAQVSGVSRISFRGDSKFFLKSGGICMARSAMQRVAKPRVC